MTKWLYAHGGQIFGPMTGAEMRERAARGDLLATDTVWKEGAPPQKGTPAGRVLDFRALGAAETAAPAGIKVAIDPVLFGAESRGARRKVAKPAAAPEPNAPAPVPSDAPAPLPVQMVQVAMVATPLPEAIPVDPPMPVPAVEVEGISASVEEETAEDVPAAIPVDERAVMAAAIASVHQAGLALNERYRRACSVLSQWADQDGNVPLVLTEDVEAICKNAEVLQILSAFQDQPFDVMERLMEHLDSMVQNRASYYRALAQRGKSPNS